MDRAPQPRPLYRWFGLLVITFLGWGWWWSTARYRAAWFNVQTERWGIHVADGTVAVERFQMGTDLRWFHSIGAVSATTDEAPPDLFPRAIERSPWERLGGNGYPTWAVAHWFLILLFLVPWAGWLAWRWHRIKRLTKVKPNP
jgi:hypothetical protein